MRKFLVLFTVLILFSGCSRVSNRVGFSGSAPDSAGEGHRSAYHIQGWLTDYECVADLSGVNDVIVFVKLCQGYEGEGLVADQWGWLRFKTVEEVGLSDRPEVKYLPNDKWTGVISEEHWVPLKAYVESKL